MILRYKFNIHIHCSGRTLFVLQAVGCCLFPSTETVENIPLEARWLFNDLTKTAKNDDVMCTFISPLTDKVTAKDISVLSSIQLMLALPAASASDVTTLRCCLL